LQQPALLADSSEFQVLARTIPRTIPERYPEINVLGLGKAVYFFRQGVARKARGRHVKLQQFK
jgi:hypothetical protein